MQAGTIPRNATLRQRRPTARMAREWERREREDREDAAIARCGRLVDPDPVARWWEEERERL